MVTIGNLRFSTQSGAIRHFTAIRKKYPLGATVAGKDVDDLLNLLQHHADRGAPNRKDVEKFIVDRSDWGKPCFYAVRRDGTRMALSTSRSAAYNATPIGAAKRAFRLLAKNETKLARNRLIPTAGAVRCFHCPNIVAVENVEMDHYPLRFDSLLNHFLQAQGLEISKIKTRDDGGGLVALDSPDMRRAWMEFHRTHAELVPSCRSCNREG